MQLVKPVRCSVRCNVSHQDQQIAMRLQRVRECEVVVIKACQRTSIRSRECIYAVECLEDARKAAFASLEADPEPLIRFCEDHPDDVECKIFDL